MKQAKWVKLLRKSYKQGYKATWKYVCTNSKLTLSMHSKKQSIIVQDKIEFFENLHFTKVGSVNKKKNVKNEKNKIKECYSNKHNNTAA